MGPSTAQERTQVHGMTLLWRMIQHTDTVEQVSGSILCLGELHEETAQAFLFQNFEGPVIATDHVGLGDSTSYDRSKRSWPFL